MFSGLVETKTQVKAIAKEPGGILLTLVRPAAFDDIQIGDSIAINGCCLTVVACDSGTMSFQAGEETLSLTTIGKLKSADFVNVERSLRLGDRIGGHLVTGHIDGLARVAGSDQIAEWTNLTFEAPSKLMQQMASKGSITVDGVSLTLVNVTEKTFSVALIPHTLQETTLGQKQIGDIVNLETDLLAKYVQRQLQFQP